jgi:hypothetical protein
MVNSHFFFKIHMYNLYWGLQAWHTLHQQWSAWNFSMWYQCNKSFGNKTVCTNALFYTIVIQRHVSPFAELPHITVTTAMVKITILCLSCIFLSSTVDERSQLKQRSRFYETGSDAVHHLSIKNLVRSSGFLCMVNEMTRLAGLGWWLCGQYQYHHDNPKSIS